MGMSLPGKGIDFDKTENWNVAADYTRLKIMKHLYLADEYELIATFGSSELLEQLQYDDQQKLFLRIRALGFFAKILELIVSNTVFAVKPASKQKFEELLTLIKDIQHVIPAIETISVNQRTKVSQQTIDEKKFHEILRMLSDIKVQINEPLNEANLIFKKFEEYDAKKMKEFVASQMGDNE